MKIVFTGGGTLGHILPSVSVVRELRRAYPNPSLKIYYLSPKHEYGEVLLAEEKVQIKRIISGKIRRYFDWQNILDIFKIPLGVFQALWHLFFLAPDLVFSSSGYGAFPVSLAAFLLRIPLILQESDIMPGLCSKISSRFAFQVFTSFVETKYFPKEKTIFLGNPVRRELFENGSKQKAKELFSLQADKPLLLILGGSQGSKSINNLMLEILPELLKNFEILHQTGPNNIKQVATEGLAFLNEKTKPYYHVLPFLNEEQQKHALFAADLIISRAGSGALFEIAAAKKPSILVPLPNSAQDHQVKNGYVFAEAGACEVIEEQNLKPNFFLQRLGLMVSDRETMAKMAENAGYFAKPEAGRQIANFILEYLALN